MRPREPPATSPAASLDASLDATRRVRAERVLGRMARRHPAAGPDEPCRYWSR